MITICHGPANSCRKLISDQVQLVRIHARERTHFVGSLAPSPAASRLRRRGISLCEHARCKNNGKMVRHTNFGVIVILCIHLTCVRGIPASVIFPLKPRNLPLLSIRIRSLPRLPLPLRRSTANEHHRASIQRSRIAPLAPLHIGESEMSDIRNRYGVRL